MGGGIREQCGSNKRCTGSPFLGSLKKPNNWSDLAGWGDGGRCGEVAHATATKNIWLVTRVGGWGEAWGGGPWRAGKGGDGGGAPESSTGSPFLAPLKT